MNAIPPRPASVALPRQPIADEIHAKKYALPGEDVAATIARVSGALFEADPRAAEYAPQLAAAMHAYEFLPGGRIIAGAGTGRNVTLFNCFVMGAIPDNMAGIFDQLKEAALTMQTGGGIGYDFSTIRPKGAPVRGVEADASGPLSFMDVWNAMCQTIMSAGSRRGAMMATMRCDHPDIEAFIDAKREAGRLRMFNLSVLVTDAFMAAVDADAAWDLVFEGRTYRTIQARELWRRIMEATYAYAEPGVIFIDRINQQNNLAYCESISATNPCGEVPLPPYGACLLGSINLAALIRDPFTPRARFDYDRLAVLVPVAVRSLDNVIDSSAFALPRQAAEALAKRRMGLGITGLADALLMMGLTYGTGDAVEATAQWMAALRRAAYLASVDLAVERGPFPLFDRDQYLAGTFAQTLDADVRDAIAAHGIRNSHLLAVAPTGTISLLAGNVSSGIEPVFAWRYTRTVRQPDGTEVRQPVYDPAYLLYCERRGLDPAAEDTLAGLPAAFVTTQTLSPSAHIAMQAAVQRLVDQSISKTINLPADIPFSDFEGVYRQAYAAGVKGCTTYRPNGVTGSVLETTAPAPSSPAPSGAVQAPTKRPDAVEGVTVRVTNPTSDENIYITVNHQLGADGCRRIYEVFAKTYDAAAEQILSAATLAISLAYQAGNDALTTKLLSRYAKVRGDDTIWFDGHSFTSVLQVLVHVIRRRESDLATECATSAGPALPSPVPHAHGPACPKCGGNTKSEGGCVQCLDCGHSKCH